MAGLDYFPLLMFVIKDGVLHYKTKDGLRQWITETHHLRFVSRCSLLVDTASCWILPAVEIVVDRLVVYFHESPKF